MKKLILFSLFIFIITGCNKQIFDFNYSFDTIICNYNGDKFELNIEKWNDYEGEQLQVRSNGKVYLLSANNCYMVSK